MAEKPIIFGGPMVRAILAGTKTQTRRVMKLETGGNGYGRLCRAGRYIEVGAYGPTWIPVGSGPRELCPRDVWMQYAAYQPGDTLWVREGWRTGNRLDKDSGSNIAKLNYEAGYREDGPKCPIWYEADGLFRQWGDNDIVDFGEKGRYRHARFMPRWASRITLEVTDVRVQRVQEISEADAIAEGVEPCARGIYHPCIVRDVDRPCACSYADLWDSINAKRGFGWTVNPWVFAYTFRVLEVKR